MDRERRLYIFGWPGAIGGASTKLAHLLRLLHKRFRIVVVPNEDDEVSDPDWRPLLDVLLVSTSSFKELPERLHGWGLSLCNFEFLLSPKWAEARRRGLKMAWSNEMMWTHPGELGAVFTGMVDRILYVSEVQRESLEPHYVAARTGSLKAHTISDRNSLWGELKHASGRHLPWAITGNYVDPSLFPAKDSRLKKPHEPIVVGRLSRADPDKFPDNFPASYENLGLRNAHFRVMAWNEPLAQKYSAYQFDSRWELLPAMKEEPLHFLQSLDLFVYSVGPNLRESWGRAIVEAMLSGVVPLVPGSPNHHLRNLVKHGESGFLCADDDDFGKYARMLENDPQLLADCSRRARQDAVTRLCSAPEHIRLWENALPDL
jgi:glycosyltransferase involved in cell wall biosynthesis